MSYIDVQVWYYRLWIYMYTCKLSRRVQWFSQWCFIQNVHIMVQSTLWDTCTRYKKNQFYLQWSFHNQLISSTYSLLSCLLFHKILHIDDRRYDYLQKEGQLELCLCPRFLILIFSAINCLNNKWFNYNFAIPSKQYINWTNL